ncbi:MAG: hypothetical protein KC983_11555, partial [Phycisphaerales bacterium]|nr:hypothetical protein [Phycisphaerales bacterium]
AARALVFYPAKLVNPTHLAFFYERWPIDGINIVSALAMLVVVGVAITCIVLAIRGVRGPFVAMSFYAGTVFPAIGFFDVYPHKFSFVADHFVYLASIGVIALLVGLAAHGLRTHRRLGAAFAAVVLLALSALSYRHTFVFQSLDTLWLDTIAKTPSSWMPYNNLSAVRLREAGAAMRAGDTESKRALAREAADFARNALALRPDHDKSHSNLAEAYRLLDDIEPALEHQQEAIRLITARIQEHTGDAAGPKDEAFADERAEEYFKLARLLHLQQRWDETEAAFRQAIDLAPNEPSYEVELARFYERQGRPLEARSAYERALDLDAGLIPIIAAYARICAETDEPMRAMPRLDAMLRTVTDPALSAQLHDVAANLYFRAGDRAGAIARARTALDFARMTDDAFMINAIRDRLAIYEQPVEDD